MNLKWIIYCRVSSAKQVKEWNWLSSQEKRCRDYAENTLWISVEKVFNDEWVSWWVFERKSIQELFKYIDSNKSQNYIVIFEDLNRLSRDIQVHSLLKAEFKKRWVELASPNFQFEESPEWDFKENISVVVAQYEKDKNKQRVNSRMRARLEQWFWCFRVPIWFTYSECKNGWKIVVQDEQKAKVIKKWFEDYSNGIIDTTSELIKFFHKKWLHIVDINKKWNYKSLSTINNLLRNVLYTGYLELPKWNISLRKAKHSGIISMETYEKIQQRLISKSKKQRYIESNANRNDISTDFPLRGFLYCEESNGMLSSGWSRWKKEKFPYYTYPKKSSMKWKWINRDNFHKDFESYLENIKPSDEFFEAFEYIVKQKIEERNKDKIIYKEKLQQEIKQIDKKIHTYINRIWNTQSEILISNYEWEIEKLELEKKKKTQEINQELKNVWTPLKNKIKKFKNSLDIWKKWNLENQKDLIKNIFPQGIPINKKKQVWTPTFSLIYQAFEVSKVSKIQLVELMGFEPMS